MDKYMVATIHPFVLGQEIMIYNKDKCIKVVECTLDTMCDIVYSLCERYDINEVHFIGGQLYALKFKDNFTACKYGKRKINVSIQ